MTVRLAPGDAARLIGYTEASRKRRYKILFKAIHSAKVSEDNFPYIEEVLLYNDLRYFVKKGILDSNSNKVFLRKDKRYWLTDFGKRVIKQARKAMFPTVTG